MSNATDSYERVVQGFEELLARLRAVDERGDTAKRIRLNTEAKERALNRVWKEYRALGLEPPSDLALSVTARQEFQIGIAYSEAAE